MKKIRFRQRRIILSLLMMVCVMLTGCTAKNNQGDESENESPLSVTVSPNITEGQEAQPSEQTVPSETATVPLEKTEDIESEGSASQEENSANEQNENREVLESEGTRLLEEKAKRYLAEMTLEEKVGQMFFVRYEKDTALSDLSQYHVSGFILFGRDFENQTKESIMTQMEEIKEASEYPLIIGVDEEGGTVNRVSRYTAFRDTPFLSPQQLYKKGGFDLIVSDTIEKAKLLLGLGINMNLAPVCDVTKSSDDYMYARSFGKGAEETSVYVQKVVSTMKDEGILSVLKHFPGYGNNGNTHTDICVDNRPYETFLEEDFLPFQAGIDAGADAILVSHNIVTCMDADMPASLSANVHTILREKLGFEGVIMTDDLVMEAITKYTDGKAAAIEAVKAGNDLLIASDYQTQIPAVIEAVQSGEISEDTIDQAVMRVLIMKLRQSGIE